MESYEALMATLALTMGASWASGINLYAALLVLGIGGSTGNIDLPPDLQVLQDPMVIMAAGVMYFTEFFVDKTPGIDTGWDTIHTFIRIPAGAMLAAGAVGDVTPALEIAAAIMGGGLSAASHFTKAGTRAMINTSPEPFTNWGASIGEDVLVLAGLWTALNHPIVFLVLLFLFIILAIWLLPKIWRALKAIFGKLGRLLGIIKDEPESGTDESIVENKQELEAGGIGTELEKLKNLQESGALSTEEYEQAKRQLLGDVV